MLAAMNEMDRIRLAEQAIAEEARKWHAPLDVTYGETIPTPPLSDWAKWKLEKPTDPRRKGAGQIARVVFDDGEAHLDES
jgi:hypothetical protein